MVASAVAVQKTTPDKMTLTSEDEKDIALMVIYGAGPWGRNEDIDLAQEKGIRAFHTFGGKKLFDEKKLLELMVYYEDDKNPPIIKSLDVEGGPIQWDKSQFWSPFRFIYSRSWQKHINRSPNYCRFRNSLHGRLTKCWHRLLR